MADSILDIEYFMAAIRSTESSNDYGAIGIDTGGGARASGAYQFMDATWDGYMGYARAVDAPPEIQDQRARELMSSYFKQFGRWDAVAIAWHAGPGRAQDYVSGDLDISTLSDGLSTTDQYTAKVIDLMGSVDPVGSGSVHDGMDDCPVCSWSEVDFSQFANGEYPDWALTAIPGGDALRTGAESESWKALVAAAQADGVTITVSDAYRPIVDQQRLADELGIYGQGGWAAVPGTSNHGLGRAVDVNIGDNPAAREWLVQHAADFGWFDPMSDEPWHFEYDPNLDPDPERWDQPFLGDLDSTPIHRPIDINSDGAIDRFEAWISSVTYSQADLVPAMAGTQGHGGHSHGAGHDHGHGHDHGGAARPLVSPPSYSAPVAPAAPAPIEDTPVPTAPDDVDVPVPDDTPDPTPVDVEPDTPAAPAPTTPDDADVPTVPEDPDLPTLPEDPIPEPTTPSVTTTDDILAEARAEVAEAAGAELTHEPTGGSSLLDDPHVVETFDTLHPDGSGALDLLDPLDPGGDDSVDHLLDTATGLPGGSHLDDLDDLLD